MNQTTRADQPGNGGFLRDDLPYILPMAGFLLLTEAGRRWPSLYTPSYVLKMFLAAVLLGVFWKRYTPIRWRCLWPDAAGDLHLRGWAGHFAGRSTCLWLGALFGIAGVVQWVGMEKALLAVWDYPRPSAVEFNPYQVLGHNPVWMWCFIIIRWAGASLVVPVMEELFWRDYLWRTIQAPNNFRLAQVGEADWKAILVVAAFCASVHIQWITALVWALMMAWLLVRTRSLGVCIVAHGVTNFLLGLYVQCTGDWYFW